MNELLGGKEAGEGEAVANMPKTEAELPERAPDNFQPDASEATASEAAKPAVSRSPLPKPGNITHAMCERAMQTWTKRQRAHNLSEKQCQPKPMNLPNRATCCRMLFAA